MNMVTVEKVKKHSHIVGSEVKTEFETDSERVIQLAKEAIQGAVNEHLDFVENDPSDFEQSEINAALDMEQGHYSFDCGDFVYNVEVK